ncbi:FecR family protein [Pedobacter alpinus]|uniref:FecR family protein n=1 Tax=Pedobacter alpinus TaxID=1590643 RepID=A0ABW5TTZ6_9SPHI
MNKNRITLLYKKYLADDCTAEELNELKSLMSDNDHQEEISNLLDETWVNLTDSELIDFSESNSTAIFNKIVNSDKKENKQRFIWMKYAAAILVMLGLGASIWMYNFKENTVLPTKNTAKVIPEIKPGSNKATLTLDNGSKIDLEKQGIVVVNNKVNYSDGSLLMSAENEQGLLNQTQYLSLNTPCGGEYQVELSDGTKVWLNADSRLRYPVDFEKDKRVVELEGEAYFEVAKMSEKPFIVKTENQEVKVLGTHFNINSYGYDKGIKTTLLEGSIMVSRTLKNGGMRNPQSRMLVPGEQSYVSENLKAISVKKVNTTEAVDWKEGLFIFNDEPIQSITKRLEKWYSVKFVYDKNEDFSKVRFAGNYARSKSLNNLLNNIALTGLVQFKVEGSGKERRIMVTNY